MGFNERIETFFHEVLMALAHHKFWLELGSICTVIIEKFSFMLPNIADISGSLYILRIQCEFTQTQCEEGARDVSNIGVT